MRRRVAIGVALLVVAACSPGPEAPRNDDNWVGTITSEGNVTTVVNESGSAWGGAATLVEEASIGVESGADEYMLGDVSGVVATQSHIVVADPQVPAVRVYDMVGRHVRVLGREGQGPGEYGTPMELGVRPDGNIVVKDGSRLVIFSIEGDGVATWTAGRMLAFTMIEMPLVVTQDGTPHAPVVVELVSPDTDSWKWGMLPIVDGDAGLPVDVPHREGVSPLRLQVGDSTVPVPFSPEEVWAFTPSGAMIVGNSAAYEFEVHQATDTVLAVQRADWVPVPVAAAEADWYRADRTTRMRRFAEGWVWNGPDVPDTKPAYQRLMPDQSGRIWVQRAGRGEHVPECRVEDGEPAECWRDIPLVDVFGADGRLLGEVTIPEGLRFYPRPFVRDDMVIGVVEDEAGTIMVKRYRLVLPGEEGQ